MKSETNESESINYPMLEKLLDQPKPDLEIMKAHQNELQSMAKSGKTAKEKAAAKQALGAYDQFFKLFKQLLEVREKMAKNQSK